MAKKFRIPLKKSRPSDPQQEQLYRMENEAIGARSYLRMTRPAILRICRAVTRAYGIRSVKVRFRSRGDFKAGKFVWAAAYWFDQNMIEIGSKKVSRDLLTVLHELAHHLHDTLTGGTSKSGHQDHGPEFLACYMSILDTCRFIPIDAMRCVLRRYNLKFIDPGTQGSLTVLKARITKKRRKRR